MRKLICAICSLPYLFWSGGVSAKAAEQVLDILDAPVSYTATYAVSDSKGVYTGTVWHEPGRERRDFETKHGSQTALLRRDQDAAYLINSSAKWYVAVAFHAALSLAGGWDDFTLIREKIGPERMEGEKTIHYHLKADSPSGRGFVGDLWALPSGVPVKIFGLETEPNGKQNTVSLIQTHILVGPVNAAANLEVPHGYMAIDLKKVTAENLIKTIQSLGPLLGGAMK